MIADSKKQATKSLNQITTMPKTVKELEQLTEIRKKEVLGKSSTVQSQHQNKNQQLLQSQMEKNELLLQKAKELQERLDQTNKKFNEAQQRVAPAKDSLAKRDLQNSKIVPLESRPLYPDTILETSNPADVKNVIELLIASQKCQPVEQQSVLNYELLFKDPDFGPEASYNPIYFEGDLDAN